MTLSKVITNPIMIERIVNDFMFISSLLEHIPANINVFQMEYLMDY
jgi:hypothetical protein